MKKNREFDVILWGASGFTGHLVAEYFIKQYGYPGELKWAIAGRSQSKLEQIRTSLGNENIPLVIADSRDKISLDAMVARGKVICSTVGPYAKYGDELVASCVEYGTDYCDLAGEPQWIRKMIDRHHEAAKQSGSRIVHCCGFDSIPSDLGVYFIQKAAKEKTGEYCNQVKMRVKALKGGFSGGTYASIANAVDELSKDKKIAKTVFNPYGLNPEGEQNGPDKDNRKDVLFDQDIGEWTMPFIMSFINAKIVRRSHALSGYLYGKDFAYDESMVTGKGFIGRLTGLAGLVGLAGLMAYVKLNGVIENLPTSQFKTLLSKALTPPGDGPSKAAQENGFFKFIIIAKWKNGQKIEGMITGDRDPGYGSTSKMIGESAVCLALDSVKTPQISGVLTPSTAMGDALIDRLQTHAGVCFSVVSP